ncbi:transposase family protein [Streptomyces sp. DT193]|uniref:transposase family protein n=1 Tax=Streptomyces sp. DT193 TaxID=3393418 RepID=UPI003CF973E7
MFTDRVIATLVILRFQLPHVALAVLYDVGRSTITRAVHEIRPLPAARGFAVPGHGDLWLRTRADVFAYASAEGVELRMDCTEVCFSSLRESTDRVFGLVPGSLCACRRSSSRRFSVSGASSGIQ